MTNLLGIDVRTSDARKLMRRLKRLKSTEGVEYGGAYWEDRNYSHANCDWGEVDADDRDANNYAAANEERVLSAYTVAGTKIWIITEWDRSVTTVLFPDEY